MFSFAIRAFFFVQFVVITGCSLSSEQIAVLSKIKEQTKKCSPSYLFSREEISSKDKYFYFSYKLNQLLELAEKSNYQVEASFSKELNLIPVNNCVLRGNRNFKKLNNLKILRENFRVSRLINSDKIVNNFLNQDSGFQDKLNQNPILDYQYFDLSSTKYPTREQKTLIKEILDLLAQATPNQKVYLSCFFGKHRTGLLSGIYQFLFEYSLDSKNSCDKASFEKDKIYLQMNQIANLGFFTYDMPFPLKKFYLDFKKAVCQNKSKEFINK